MALVRKPAAHSSQNTPVRSACSRVNEGSSRGSSAAGGSPASVLRPNCSGRSRNSAAANGQNGECDKSGKGEIGASPAVERDETIDQLREAHGTGRESETCCRGGNPAPPHKPQIDDLLTDEAKSADRSATQQGEADEQHHCGLNCRHESAGEGEASGDDGCRQARPTPVDPAADHRRWQNPCKRSNPIGDRG